MEDVLLQDWEKKSADHQKVYKQFLLRANKNKVLKALPSLHDEAFEKIDCLQCGNCCKGFSPRFKTPDIKRIAKHLKMKDGDFINQYLFVDSEGDHVLKTKPCSFLGQDNYCLSPSNGDSLWFPIRPDCILSKLGMANPSLFTNTRSVSECPPYPANRN
jgi:hypothetical protein